MKRRSPFDATKIKDIKKLLEIGERKFNEGIYYDAIDCYNQAIRLDNRCEMAYIGRAQLRLIFDDDYGGIDDLRKAWNINPNHPMTHFILGNHFLGEKRYKDSIPFFEKVIDLDKTLVSESHYSKAFALSQLLDFHDSHIPPDDSALTQSQLAQLDMIIQECNLAMAGNGPKWLPLSLRGAVYIEKKLFLEALDDLTKAVEMNPNYAFSLLNEGEALLKLNRYKEASEVFDRLESLLGIQGDTASVKGLTELLQGNHPRAVFEFSKGIEVDQTRIDLYRTRAITKAFLENYLGAELDYQKVVELDPRNGEHYLQLGRIQLKLKKVDQACLSFNRAGDLGCEEAYDEIKEHCGK